MLECINIHSGFHFLFLLSTAPYVPSHSASTIELNSLDYGFLSLFKCSNYENDIPMKRSFALSPRAKDPLTSGRVSHVTRRRGIDVNRVDADVIRLVAIESSFASSQMHRCRSAATR
jgi:hypothetical protein